MTPRVVEYKNWADFTRRFLTKYHERDRARRRQLLFPGQADSRWHLLTTLDRAETFVSAAVRERRLTELVGRFRAHAHTLAANLELTGDLEWELFGRHHGLPTSVLDFSYSPYVAAYFAFHEPAPPGAGRSSIWALDLAGFDTDATPQVAIIDDEAQIRFNPRAQLQNGLFVKMKDVGPVERVLSARLTRHDLPTGRVERAGVLSVLDAMLINARTLFRDLDGAARAARTDVLVFTED